MPKLKVFYLNGCPYCKNAVKAVDELLAENPAYGTVELEWIEERENSDIAESYDYYYVPSIFCNDEKLYECSPNDEFEKIKQQFENALKTALGDPA